MPKVVEDSEDYTSQEYVKKFAKRMLKTHLFTGTFIEKRFVDPLNSYRDVIKIDKSETKFIQNLLAVKRKIEQNPINAAKPWIGVTEPDTIGAPAGYNVWTNLPVEIFGKYWYQVKTVEFFDNEIRLKLDVVREVDDKLSSSTNHESLCHDEIDFATQLSVSLNELPNKIKENLNYFYFNYVTLENFKESVIFLSVLVGTIFAASVNVTKYLLEYLLKLIRELTAFIKVSTPIIITSLNIIGKLVYGFYFLIATLFRKNPPPQEVRYNYYVDPNMLQYANDYKQRSNGYFNKGRAIPYPRSGVRITPLED